MGWATRPPSRPGEYGPEHRTLRARLAPLVEAGEVDCWRCGTRIQAGERWALGHSDDRARYEGAEHERCSNQSGARLGGSRSWAKREPMKRPGEAHPGLIAP